MRGLGIEHLFSTPRVGGFGSDHWDRDELVKTAALRAVELFGSQIDVAKHSHIGDTPKDVTAARAGGAQAVGVCTGVFTRAHLEEANADAVVLDSLADTQAVLQHLL